MNECVHACACIWVRVCMCACVRERVCMLKLFISSPKRINRFSSGKAYSLHLAEKKRYPDGLEFLLYTGARQTCIRGKIIIQIFPNPK